MTAMRGPGAPALVLALFLLATFGSAPCIHGQSNETDIKAPALAEVTRLEEEGERAISERRFADASTSIGRALALQRQALGEIHLDVAQSLSRLGAVAYYQGNYGQGAELASQALKIREAILGPNHDVVAESLSDVASMLLVAGDYVRPEPLFQRALGIYETASAQRPTDVELTLSIASVYGNLALLYQRRGNFVLAEQNYLKALGLRERTRGPDSPSVAETAANLGGVYYASAQYEKAAAMLQRALAIQEQQRPPPASLSTTCFNLAAVHFDQGHFAEAQGLFERALALDEQLLGPSHPRVAIRLAGLGENARLTERFAQADELYRRALSIREQALGPSHPLVAETFIAIGLLRYAMGDTAAAADYLSRGLRLRDDTLSLVLASGSEDAKQRYLSTLADETDIAISVQLGAENVPAAASLAFTSVLQRKGRALDAMADQLSSLRARLNADDRGVLNELADTRKQLAGLILGGVSTDSQRASAETLKGRIDRLENTISARSAEFRSTHRTASLDEIRRSLPEHAALIELVSYRPFLIRKPRRDAFGPLRYAAYVLGPDGLRTAVDLGDAAVVDREVHDFRSSLAGPGRPALKATAQALYKRLIVPLRGSIADTDRLFISPDGALNLIPFAAILAENGKYLIEDYRISYLTSGRDLLNIGGNAAGERSATSPPAIFANPQFAGLGTSSRPKSSQTSPRDDTDGPLSFTPLPGTAQEASMLAPLLPGAQLHTGTAQRRQLSRRSTVPRSFTSQPMAFSCARAFQDLQVQSPGLDTGSMAAPPRAIDWTVSLALFRTCLAGAEPRVRAAPAKMAL
jgi:tetratricopeptide (TPR) repeat protein/CHAT domain-containing protein